MAISITSAGQEAYLTSQENSYEFGPFQPTGSRLILVGVFWDPTVTAGVVNPSSLTHSGLDGGSFVQIGSGYVGSSVCVSIWGAITGASTSSATLTVNTPEDGYWCLAVIDEVDGADISGTVANAIADSNGGATNSIALGAFASSDNAGYGIFTETDTLTKGANFTLLSQVAGARDGLSEWAINETTPNCTPSADVGMALEIKAAAGVVSATPGAGVLSYVGHQPLAGHSGSATPGVANLTYIGYLPTVTVAGDTTVTPGTGTLTYATYQTTVVLGIVHPGITTESTTAVGSQVDISATPGPVVLTYVGYAPTVTTPVVVEVTPGVAALEYTGYAPTITAIATIEVTPGTGRLFYRGWRPSAIGTRIRGASWGKPMGGRGPKTKPPEVDEHAVTEGSEPK
jgi:hypothetical protein